MKEFFEVYPLAAWSIVSLLLAAVAIASIWEKVKWWWFNTWVSFPLIGRIARLSRDFNEDPANSGWLTSERTLCDEYKNFVHVQDEHDFNEKITYLTKAGDNGRKSTPIWIWLLTVSMVFVEAMGFSYVLAGYSLSNASENMQQAYAYGIAFLISIILVALTHLSGHQLYISELIKNARRERVAYPHEPKPDLRSNDIPLARPQSQDDHMPAYTQLCNRVGIHPSNILFIITIIFVMVVAGAATYVRGQVLEKELDARVTLSSNASENSSRSASNSLDMTTSNVRLPDADNASNQATDKKVAIDEANIDRHGGWATFIVLAFVFVFLQILGLIFGYRWGFAGKNSADAYRDIGSGRFSSYSAVREHYRRIADTAQAKLAVLQQKMIADNSNSGSSSLHLTKTFRDYIQETRIADEKDRHNERKHATVIATQHATPIHATPATAAPTDLPIVTKTTAATALPDVAQIMSQLNALGDDKEAKKALINSLPEAINAQVRVELKKQKEENERKARQADAELEDLL